MIALFLPMWLGALLRPARVLRPILLLWPALLMWSCLLARSAMASDAEPPPDPMAAVRADRWADASAAAAHYADPVAGKLVTYFRLLAPGAATAQEIEAFVA